MTEEETETEEDVGSMFLVTLITRVGLLDFVGEVEFSSD